MAEQLTTLEAAKAWVKIGQGQTPAAPNDDAMLSRLISAASAMMINYTNRQSFGAAQFIETYTARGLGYIMLRQFPVISVQSVGSQGAAYQASTGPTVYGYTLDQAQNAPAQLRMIGGGFGWGSPIDVTYTAGYANTDELATVDMTTHQAIPLGVFSSDMGVTYAISGLPLVAVTGTPGAGQYKVIGGVYQFSAADAGAKVLLNYGTIPDDVQQACLETVAERCRYRERVGEASRSQQNGTSVTYGTWDLNPFVKSVLQPFKNVVPV